MFIELAVNVGNEAKNAGFARWENYYMSIRLIRFSTAKYVKSFIIRIAL